MNVLSRTNQSFSSIHPVSGSYLNDDLVIDQARKLFQRVKDTHGEGLCPRFTDDAQDLLCRITLILHRTSWMVLSDDAVFEVAGKTFRELFYWLLSNPVDTDFGTEFINGAKRSSSKSKGTYIQLKTCIDTTLALRHLN